MSETRTTFRLRPKTGTGEVLEFALPKGATGVIVTNASVESPDDTAPTVQFIIVEVEHDGDNPRIIGVCDTLRDATAYAKLYVDSCEAIEGIVALAKTLLAGATPPPTCPKCHHGTPDEQTGLCEACTAAVTAQLTNALRTTKFTTH